MGFIVEKGPTDDLDDMIAFDTNGLDFDDEFKKLFRIKDSQMKELIELENTDEKKKDE